MVAAAAIPAVIAGIQVGGVAISAMAKAIQALYGMAGDLNAQLDKHIADMQGSDNPTVSRSGRILEMAKLGFGIGYVTPVIIISVGQFLLGNTFAAVATIATAATMTNPIAMTCAAIGAIYYGWGALSDVERNEILDKLSIGLEVGIALISAVVRFVIDTTKGLLSSKNFEEMKKYVSAAAAGFGKSLGDITHKLTDVLSDSVDTIKRSSGRVFDATADLAGVLATETGKAINRTGESAGEAYDTVKGVGAKAIDSTVGALKRKPGAVAKKTTPDMKSTFAPVSQPAAQRPKAPKKRHALDLNGDGKVDHKDLMHAIKRKGRKGHTQLT